MHLWRYFWVKILRDDYGCHEFVLFKHFLGALCGDEYHGVPWDDRTFSSWQRVKMPHSLGIMTDERDDLWTKSRAQETITLLTLGFSFLKCWYFVYSSMYLLTYYMLSFFTTSPWYMSYIEFETMFQFCKNRTSKLASSM